MKFLNKLVSLKIFVILLAVVAVASVVFAVVPNIRRDGNLIQIDKKIIRPIESRTIPGETSEESVRGDSGFVDAREIAPGVYEFDFDSGVYLRPEIVRTENGVVVEEIIPVNSDDYTDENYPHIIDMLSNYGEPHVTYTGSFRHGPFVRTFVYPEQGFAFVGNPSTDEVVEYQYYIPMDLQSYEEIFSDEIISVQAEHEHL